MLEDRKFSNQGTKVKDLSLTEHDMRPQQCRPGCSEPLTVLTAGLVLKDEVPKDEVPKDEVPKDEVRKYEVVSQGEG